LRQASNQYLYQHKHKHQSVSQSVMTWTCLHEAIREGSWSWSSSGGTINWRTVVWDLKRGGAYTADTRMDDDGVYPIHMPKLYMEHRVPPNVLVAIMEANPRALLYPFPDATYRLPIHEALNHNMSSDMVIRRMLQLAPQTSQMKNSQQELPLHRACASAKLADQGEGQGELGLTGDQYQNTSASIEMILNHYPAGASEQDTSGCTPLHVACSTVSISPEMIERIYDACPDALRKTNTEGDSPLHCACRKLGEDVVSFLLQMHPQGATLGNKAGFTPLHYACQSSKISQQALESWFQVNPQTLALQGGVNGATPFQMACLSLHSDFDPRRVRYLYESFPHALLMRDAKGVSPLWYPPSHTCQFILTVLEESTPNIWDLRDSKGNTLLHVASCGISGMLLDIIVDRRPTLVCVTNHKGELPLHTRLKQGSTRKMAVDCRALLLHYPQSSATTLSDCDCDDTSTAHVDDNRHMMPFMLAAMAGEQQQREGCINTTFLLLRMCVGFHDLTCCSHRAS
jgi:ankyrin repeat protein